MARIRTIKPDFWTDGNMIGLTPFARLFFIGLWNFTLCDRGHLPDDPMGLKLKILPADSVDPFELVEELLGRGRVTRLSMADGRTFLFVPRFVDHQKLDTRWNSRCPACAQLASSNPAETHASLGELSEPRSGGEGRGGERNGEERKGGADAQTPALKPFCSNHPDGTDSPCRACGNARRAYDAELIREKTKPTASGIVTDPDCPKHPGRPLRGCDRCEEDS